MGVLYDEPTWREPLHNSLEFRAIVKGVGHAGQTIRDSGSICIGLQSTNRNTSDTAALKRQLPRFSAGLLDIGIRPS
jgi:hypothetical protein